MGNSEQIFHSLTKQLLNHVCPFLEELWGSQGQCENHTDTQRTLHQDQALTSYPLHLHAPCLDAALGQALLGDDAADVVREDKGGLEDGEGL